MLNAAFFLNILSLSFYIQEKKDNRLWENKIFKKRHSTFQAREWASFCSVLQNVLFCSVEYALSDLAIWMIKQWKLKVLDRTSYFPASFFKRFLTFPFQFFYPAFKLLSHSGHWKEKKKTTTQKPTLESQNVIFFYPIFLFFLAFFKLFSDIRINYYLSPASIEKHWRLCRFGGFIVMKNWTVWFWRLIVGRERAYNCSKHQLNRCVHNRQEGCSQQLPSCGREKSEEKALHCLTVSLWYTPLVTQYSSWYQKLLLWKKKSTTYCQRWKAKENKKKKSASQTPR